LPLGEQAQTEMCAEAKATPIFLAHGRSDRVIPFTVGEKSKDALLALGCEVEWHEYNMQHSVCEQEISDIAAWLKFKIQ
jgi:phospholipase/carboxylesterase